MSRRESAAGVQQATEHRCGDPVRRVGDDVERSTGKPQVCGVDAHNGRPAREADLELLDAAWMELDGNDPAPGVDERASDGAKSGTDVQDQRPLRKVRVTDELLRDLRCELVPSPALPWLGHGDAPS